MNTQNEISLLADQELDAVVGGRINTGTGKLDKNPQYGVVTGGPANPALNSLLTGVGIGTVIFGILGVLL